MYDKEVGKIEEQNVSGFLGFFSVGGGEATRVGGGLGNEWDWGA